MADIDDYSIKDALKLSSVDSFNMKVLAIKKGKERIRCVMDPAFNDPDVRVLSGNELSLKVDKDADTWEVEFEDMRLVQVNQLTDAEISDLRREFDTYDVDKNGVISMNEVEDYFSDLLARKLRILAVSHDKRMAIVKDPELKTRMKENYVKTVELTKALIEQDKKAMEEADVDHSGTITWKGNLYAQIFL